MAEQLKAVGSIRDVINIQDFIKLLGKKVEDLLEDLIKYIVKLYVGPNYNMEMDKEVVKQP